MELFIYFIIFAFAGVGFELFWTSLLDSLKTKNPRLKGKSTFWMFPVYGSILFIVLFVRWLYPDYPWWVKGLVYMVMILAWEYISGYVLKKLVGVAPWDYSTNKTYDDMGRKKRFHLHGLICAEYAVIWFFGGLVAEIFYVFLQNHLIL